jgi:putative heme-binding domain-containing protein
LEDTHSVANGLIWGPDGWLYGGQGSTTTSRVTRPGFDPAGAPGVYFEGCMVWRYHPATKVYEIFAEGGGNTFGLEFDAEGRLYSGHNGGQTRGWHFIRAGLFLKQGVDPGKFGPQTNAYAFGELQMMPTRNPVPRFTHNVIVAEGTAIPESLRGRFIGADPLNRNLIASERYPLGSTFETSDSGVPLAGDDIAFRPVFLANTPDGSLYVADFYEEYIAHGQNYQGQIDPTTGRIYRIRGKETPLGKDVDLSKLSTEQLVKTLSHANRWHRQTAVRLLGEKRDPAATPLLTATLTSAETHPAVEALWALYQAGSMTEDVTLAALAHPSPIVRAWAVRLSADVGPIADRVFPAIRELATREASAEVRCQIAAAARRIPSKQALPLAGELLRRNEDAADAFIPLLNWWTIESHCDTSRADVLAMLADAAAWESTPMRDVIVPRLMRRFASSGTRADLLTCAKLLSAAPKPEHVKKLMEGFEQAFAGRTPPPLPKELDEALAKTGRLSPTLRFRLGEKQAIADAVKLAGDASAKAEDRLAVVTLLGEIETPSAAPTLLGIARGDETFVAPIKPGPTAAAMTKSTNDLRKAAVAALSLYADPKIAPDIAAAVKTMPAEVRPAAINLLSSRPTHAKHLLDLINAGTVARTDVPAEIVSRLTAMQDNSVANRAEKLFAAPVIPAEQAKAKRAAKADQIRKAVAAAAGDPYKGEPIYMQRCGVCHTLFHKGGAIGPNLTAYQRGDLGTMLTSILDPNAEIREGFVNYNVTTKDRRSLGGFLTDNDPAVVTLRGFDGQDVRVPRDQIVDMKAAQGSLMPEGLLGGLSEVELRDLFAYLRIPQPITN